MLFMCFTSILFRMYKLWKYKVITYASWTTCWFITCASWTTCEVITNASWTAC